MKDTIKQAKQYSLKAFRHILTNFKIFRLLNDKTYLRILYYLSFGKPLELNNPKTFNEKLQWLKLYDRNPKYTELADKNTVKSYIKKSIGKEYVIPTIKTYKKFNDINFNELPNQFVIKCTHDSGGVIVCKDKTTFNIKAARKKINSHLKKNYFYSLREWPYKNIKPKIIIEQYMEDQNDGELRDYKFFTFNGDCKLMFIASNRQGKTETYFDFYDDNFKHLSFTNGHPNAPTNPHRPKQFQKMQLLAEKISKDLNLTHARIDFYEANSKIYFGEITFYHWSGIVAFDPPKWDEKLGEWITLPEKIGD